jgi:hypothetical protein
MSTSIFSEVDCILVLSVVLTIATLRNPFLSFIVILKSLMHTRACTNTCVDLPLQLLEEQCPRLALADYVDDADLRAQFEDWRESKRTGFFAVADRTGACRAKLQIFCDDDENEKFFLCGHVQIFPRFSFSVTFQHAFPPFILISCRYYIISLSHRRQQRSDRVGAGGD